MTREGAVLGLDFGGSKIAAALCTLDGVRRSEAVIETTPPLGARENLERGVGLGRRLLEKAGRADGTGPVELVAAGASTFGIPQDDGVALAPAIPGWDRLPLRRLLEEAFGVPVAVVTDVKAAALAEARAGALQGADPGLYVNLGTGLAAAVVAGGRVLTGAHGAAGEIAYNLRSPDDVGRNGTSGASILEDVVSGRGLSTAAASLRDGSGDGRVLGWSELPASDVFAQATSEPEYDGLVSRFVRELAYHLVNLSIAVDPAVVAVGGGMVGSWDVLAPSLRSAIDAHVPYPPALVLGAFTHDAPLRGALAEGLELATREPAGTAMISPRRT